MRLLPLTLLTLVAACATETPVAHKNGDAFCDAVMGDVDRHSIVLEREASDAAVLTGQHLIAKLDAFCL